MRIHQRQALLPQGRAMLPAGCTIPFPYNHVGAVDV
jgi:hypothetical protein